MNEKSKSSSSTESKKTKTTDKSTVVKSDSKSPDGSNFVGSRNGDGGAGDNGRLPLHPYGYGDGGP